MKNTELGPAARSPTDSEEVAKLKGELTRAAESMGDAVALHTHIHRLTEALKSASVALNVCQGWLLGLGKQREAADADRWRDEAYQAALPQTCPVCGEGRHDGTCIDLALGEARGTASASESLKEQGAPEGASTDDLRARGMGHIDAVIGLLEGLDIDYPTGKVKTTRSNQPGGTIAAALTHAKQVRKALAVPSGDALKAPLGPESAPPAPDLLRENARLREEVERHQRGKIAAENHAGALQAQLDETAAGLTRARAAHLENAELLAKANAEVEQANRSIENLNGQLDNAHRERLAAVALNTPHERRWRSLMALGEEALRHAGDALDRIARENEQHPHRAAFNRLAHWLWRACGAEPDDAAVTGTPSDKRAIRQPAPPAPDLLRENARLLAEGRAAALEEAVEIVHEEHCAAIGAAPTYAQIGHRIEYRIRALLNQGRDEVAPSPEIPAESTDPEPK